MQAATKKNPSDVIILFESSAFIGVCFETILENYLKPLLQFFYAGPISDDLGLLKDLSGVVFSAISYRSLESLPSSICSLVQPTSHAKLFCDKLENFIEFSYVEERFHIAEGLAMALDTFEDLENRRHSHKIERIPSTRHIILIASQSAYEEIPVIESNNYRGLKFDDILQSLQKLQVNLSIISPKYSLDLIKLFEKVNGSSPNTELKIDRINNNFNFLVLLHHSIHLIDYEAQQQQQKQLQQQQQQQALLQQQQQQQQAQQVQPQVQVQSGQSMSNIQETYTNIKMETNETILPSQHIQTQAYQINQQVSSQIQTAPPVNAPQQQQPQQFQQYTHQQKILNTMQGQQIQQINQGYQQNNTITMQTQQTQQQVQMQTQQDIYAQQQQQQQIKLQMSQQTQQVQQPIGQGQTSMPRSASNIGKVIPGQPVQVQPPIRQINQPSPQLIQSQTPPIVTVQMNPQQQQQQQQQMINYNQRFPQQAQQPAQPQQQQQNYPYTQQQQQQQQPQAQAPQQGKLIQIWDGHVEWQEKDRQNPNSKITHTVKAGIYSLSVLDQNTGQIVPEVPQSLAQAWPPKIPLQLLGKQIVDILSTTCQPPTRNLYLISEQNNQDIKNALNIGGALINFAVNTAQEIRILLVTVQGNDIVCKIPSDQNKFLNSLKQIIQRQKQQQQRLQQPGQPGQPGPQQMMNPGMMQQGQPGMMQPGQGQPQQVIIQQGGNVPGQMINPNQMNTEQKDLRHLLISGQNPQMVMTQQKIPIQAQPAQNWLNVNQQQQQQPQQQAQQQIYIQNQQGMMQQQQPKQNYQFGYDGYS